MDISSQDLKYFSEIVRLGSISKAAEFLGLAQPSLSLAVKRIEKALGYDVFVRTKKGVIPTKSGKELLKKTNDLLYVWETILKNVDEVMEEFSGSVKFGCHPSVGLYTLKHFIPRFCRDYPAVKVNFTHDLSSKITDQVINMDLDIGLVVNPIQHPDLIIVKLFNDEVCLWKSKKKHNENVLICDTDLTQSQSILTSLKKKKYQFSNHITSGSLENIVELTKAGVGVGIIPTRVVGDSQKVLVKLDKLPNFKDEICLVYRKEQKNVKIISKLVRYIKEGLI